MYMCVCTLEKVAATVALPVGTLKTSHVKCNDLGCCQFFNFFVNFKLPGI